MHAFYEHILNTGKVRGQTVSIIPVAGLTIWELLCYDIFGRRGSCMSVVLLSLTSYVTSLSMLPHP